MLLGLADPRETALSYEDVFETSGNDETHLGACTREDRVQDRRPRVQAHTRLVVCLGRSYSAVSSCIANRLQITSRLIFTVCERLSNAEGAIFAEENAVRHGATCINGNYVLAVMIKHSSSPSAMPQLWSQSGLRTN